MHSAAETTFCSFAPNVPPPPTSPLCLTVERVFQPSEDGAARSVDERRSRHLLLAVAELDDGGDDGQSVRGVGLSAAFG